MTDIKPDLPWSIKGVTADARARAKAAAKRDGLTMGAWLSQAIESGDGRRAAGRRRGGAGRAGRYRGAIGRSGGADGRLGGAAARGYRPIVRTGSPVGRPLGGRRGALAAARHPHGKSELPAAPRWHFPQPAIPGILAIIKVVWVRQMTQRVPWSVKGITREDRELAKAAAQKAGLSVGAWLTQQIRQAAEAPSPAAAADPSAASSSPSPSPSLFPSAAPPRSSATWAARACRGGTGNAAFRLWPRPLATPPPPSMERRLRKREALRWPAMK